MATYKLSNEAKNDLIRIHQYGVAQFGEKQADIYFNTFFEHFRIIARQPYAFEEVNFIKPGYRRCVCGRDSIFYKVHNNVVEIMAIIGKQDIQDLLK